MSRNLSNVENEIKATLKNLKNGTDIRGIAIETKEHKKNLTSEIVSLIGYGFSKWLKAKNKDKEAIKVAIGMDSRLSGKALKDVLKEVFIKE